MKSKILKPIIGVLILLVSISCKIEPQKIEYGKDQCNYCKMNVVDKTHSAQYVTKKGNISCSKYPNGYILPDHILTRTCHLCKYLYFLP